MATSTRPCNPAPMPHANAALTVQPQLVRRSYIEYSLPCVAPSGPAEPTPEEQLRDNLRFVRGSGTAGRRAKQPLYRPAVLRRGESTHTAASPAASPPYSPEASMASLTMGDGSTTPEKPRSGSREYGFKDFGHAPGPLLREARCGSVMVDGRLVGRMMDKADWTPDSFRSQCSDDRCTRKFSVFERKHHCRCCGEVFCSACSASRVDLLPPSRGPRQPAASVLPKATAKQDAGDTHSRRTLSVPRPPSSEQGSSTPTSPIACTVPTSLPDRSITPAGVTPPHLVVLPCRLCDTCASSLALGIDPLATRARKPLLETSTPTYMASPTPTVPLPLAGSRTAASGSTGPSPVGSLGSRTSGGPTRRNSAASQNHQVRDRMSNSDPHINRGSADSTTSGSSQFSLATPPTAHKVIPVSSGQAVQKGKGFYHPFPHGAEGLFSFSPSTMGGVVIPTAPNYGQIWEPEVHDEDADTEVGSLVPRMLRPGETGDDGEFVPGSYSWSTF